MKKLGTARQASGVAAPVAESAPTTDSPPLASAPAADPGPVRVRPLVASAKIYDLNKLGRRLAALRNGQRVVHCHGVFDLLHIGHIRHLEQARRLGDLLVVTVTADRFVNKGPSRPAFAQRLRAEALASLSCVDYVAINDSPMADEPIRRLRPNIYVKGGEYRDAASDHTGGIGVEEEAVRDVGGRIVFTDDITFSSSSLINSRLDLLPEPARDWLADFAARHSAASIHALLDRAPGLNVLVVGETIIDEYQYCEAIGKSSKEPTLAVRQLSIERFAGGILAVGNHVANLCGRAGLVTVLGDDDAHDAFVRQSLHPGVDAALVRRDDAPTVVKRRFVDSYFFHKLFEVYEMNDTPIAGASQQALLEALESRLPHADLVIVIDFGHGMLGPRAVKLITEKSKCLALNAQSNAGNLGFHTVSKYGRADYVCLAEKELRLEARDRQGELRPMMADVAGRLDCQRFVVTRGSHGCLCWQRDEGFIEAPALAGQVRDRMGAGDTFMAASALCAALGAPMDVLAFVGNAAAAQAVATVGHRQFIQRVPLLRHIECLLK